MPSGKFALLLLKVVNALIEIYRKLRRQNRTDAVRSDPAAEWLRKFGGTDERDKPDNIASGSDDAGSGGD